MRLIRSFAGLLCLSAILVLHQVPVASESPPAAPLFEGLGNYGRKITTKSDAAQRFFDQGLLFLYAFNHDEAIRSFEQAATLDPGCGMAYWGIAVANGPHINNTAMPPDRVKAAVQAIAKARERLKACTPVEQALIEALVARYADPQPEDRKPLDEAYAKAMRAVWKRFPNDADVGALFAESLMDLWPWNLWSGDEPQPDTPEILATLEAVRRLVPAQPLANHLYIHAVEASPTPGKADAAADQLRRTYPGLGHLVHMPSHIDIRRGRWQQAIEANELAIEADRKYRELIPRQGFYQIYMSHNRHMLAFAAMMQGESQRSLDAVRALLAQIPKDWLDDEQATGFADGLFAMPCEVLLRFGKWEDLLAEPEPAARFPVARALRHAARATAFAAKGQLAEAHKAQQAFHEACSKASAKAFVGNNAAADIFAVADAMLTGEILFKEGKVEQSLAALRRAVAKEDSLRYDEPPDWIIPVRHALGAALLRAGQPVEAEAVYRADLRQWPDNGWSLFGLAQSLEQQGKDQEAARFKQRFEQIWKRADVELSSSCFCQVATPELEASSRKPPRIKPFTIAVDDAVLVDLKQRLARTRWPDQIDGTGWEYGVPLAYMKELVGHWRTRYDWRSEERKLNELSQFVINIDGIDVHFLHVRSKEPKAVPLVLVHGWPGSVYEFYKIVGRLTDPVAHGGKPEDAFHVVCPSLPGFGFSGKPTERGWSSQRMAELIAKLMAQLGYDRYGAQGGDWGGGITRWLAANDGAHCIGGHSNFPPSGPPATEPMRGVSQAELERFQQRAKELNDHKAYGAIQGTRPLTLGYGLNDSPVGLAAWIVDKFWAWSDHGGDLERSFTKDELLTNVMIYWVTDSMPSSTRIYYESQHNLPRPASMMPFESTGKSAPMGFALFPKEINVPPRAWVERSVGSAFLHWTEMPKGGHFAALEQPELLIQDVRSFFRKVRAAEP